jgi:methylated-DNA-protein-cysteine methyltransferase related protein
MKHRRADAAPGFKKNAPKHRTEDIVDAIREAIQSIPRGKVASYGQVAAAAGYPRHVRMVPRVLSLHGDGLPWFRVLGAGGAIKITDDGGTVQRMRLQAEGVRFRGEKVDIAAHEHQFLT